MTFFKASFHNHPIAPSDGSELNVDRSIESWGRNIGLETLDILGSYTLIQLTRDEARQLVTALTDAIDELEKLAP